MDRLGPMDLLHQEGHQPIPIVAGLKGVWIDPGRSQPGNTRG
jgi:hypothetical protein